jgi:hypothetical protein
MRRAAVRQNTEIRDTQRETTLKMKLRSIVGVCGMLTALLPACGATPVDGEKVEASESIANELGHELSTPVVVASGLNSPRGIAVDDDGTLYVAEAGLGGTQVCLTGQGQEGCYGESGSITRIRRGVSTRIIDDLPSIANADGTSVIGTHDVAIRGGELYAVTGLGLDPAVRAPGGALGSVAPKLGYLLRIERSPHGKYRAVPAADLAAFEGTHNPFPGPVESNPYGLLPDGAGWIVADAAGNDLLKVSHSGAVSLLTTLPGSTADAPPPLPPRPIPIDPVPTSVVRGPDGALYVGELTGFPFPVGGSRVFRIGRNGVPEVYASGFTNVIDLSFDCRGRLLVLEIASQGLASGNPAGALIRVARDGSQEVIASEGLMGPTSVAVGPRNEVYVSNCGVCGPGQGSVLRVR